MTSHVGTERYGIYFEYQTIWKRLGGSKFGSVFHPSEVNQMILRKFGGLDG